MSTKGVVFHDSIATKDRLRLINFLVSFAHYDKKLFSINAKFWVEFYFFESSNSSSLSIVASFFTCHALDVYYVQLKGRENWLCGKVP